MADTQTAKEKELAREVERLQEQVNSIAFHLGCDQPTSHRHSHGRCIFAAIVALEKKAGIIDDSGDEVAAPPVAVPASSEARGATELQKLPWWDNVHFERMAEVKRNRGFVPIEDERASQLNCRERQLRDYKAKYEAALREIAELPERPIPQGGDYRPHYPKRTADAYMDALERQLAEAQRTIAALRSKVVT